MPRIPTGGLPTPKIQGGGAGVRGRKTSVELPGSSAVRVDTGRGGGDPTQLGRALTQIGGRVSEMAVTVS